MSKRLQIYSEVGTNGDEIGYGCGFKIPLLNGATIIYIPILTEQGFIDLNNTRFIRYSLNMNISNFRFL